VNLKFNLTEKGLILVLVPLFFELVFFAVLGGLLHRTEQEAITAANFKAVNSDTNMLIIRVYETGTAVVAFSQAPTDEFISGRYKHFISQIEPAYKLLQAQVANDPQQKQLLDEVEPHLKNAMGFFEQMMGTMNAGYELVWLKTARRWIDPDHSPLNQFIAAVHRMTDYQTKKLGESPHIEDELRAKVEQYIVIGVFLNILIAISLAILVTRGVTRRVETLTDNALRLASGRELLPPPGGNDEIARLDSVFRQMVQSIADASLRERAMVDNAADVIFSLDANGKFIKVSPASTRVWGYEPEDLIGSRFSLVLLADDVEAASKTIKDISSGAGAGTVSFENRVQRKDGTVVDMRWSAQWVSSQKALFCVAHDITERKVAEDLLRANETRVKAILDNMLVGLVMTDQSGRIESVNSRTRQLFGYDEHELIGLHYDTLFSYEKEVSDGAGQDMMIVEEVKKPSMGRMLELQAKRKDDSCFPAEVTLSEFDSPEGRHLMLNLLDITERHEVERLKKEFLSMVSHDLRSPLSSVLTSLSLLSVGAFGSLNKDGQELLVHSENELNWLMQLTKDLLDIARMEAGKLDLRWGKVRVSTICEKAVMAIQGSAQQRKITLDLPEQDYLLKADGDRLTQVLVHLLSEAIRNSTDESKIEISAHIDGSEIELRVSQPAMHISSSYLKLVDDKALMMPGQTTREKRSSSLELAICKKIIEGHKGSLGASSDTRKGSALWFRVPYIPGLASRPTAEI
jgi:PAS domain S-box-containing protein